MKNKELIKFFVNSNGECYPASIKGSNLEWIGYKLYSYQTCIAQFKDDKLYLNTTKYSPTTSRHQNCLMDAIKLDSQYKNRVECISNLPRNVVSVSKEY